MWCLKIYVQTLWRDRFWNHWSVGSNHDTRVTPYRDVFVTVHLIIQKLRCHLETRIRKETSLWSKCSFGGGKKNSKTKFSLNPWHSINILWRCFSGLRYILSSLHLQIFFCCLEHSVCINLIFNFFGLSDKVSMLCSLTTDTVIKYLRIWIFRFEFFYYYYYHCCLWCVHGGLNGGLSLWKVELNSKSLCVRFVVCDIALTNQYIVTSLALKLRALSLWSSILLAIM